MNFSRFKRRNSLKYCLYNTGQNHKFLISIKKEDRYGS